MPGDALGVRVVTDVAGLDALRPDWERLAAADPSAGTFNGWSWNRTWWRHYGHLGELRVVVVELPRSSATGRDSAGPNESAGSDRTMGAGRVVGIAPFYHARTRVLRVLHPRTLRLIGTGGDTSPDDVDMLAEPRHADAAARAVCDRLFEPSGARRLLLEHVPASSAMLRAIEACWLDRPRGGRPVRTVERRAVAALPGSAETWRAGLSRNSRKHLARRRRRADGLGRIEYRHARTPAEIDAAFAELVRLHRARHASRGEAGSFASDAYVGFHRELMGELLERDELVLVSLTLDGRTIGVEYAFRCAGTVALFQTGFDPALEAASPGHLMVSHVIEDAIGRGARTVDFLRGDYPYKASYASDERRSVTLDGPLRPTRLSPIRLAALRRARRRPG